MKLQALLGAGLLAASVSAQAKLILDMPEYASFDLSGPRSSFKLDATFSVEPLGPTEVLRFYNNDFALDRLTGPDPVGFDKWGNPKSDENHWNFQLSPMGSADDLHAAFDAVIFGLEPYRETNIFDHLQVGQIYEFTFMAFYEVFEMAGCENPDEYTGCGYVGDSVSGSTILSFFDSAQDIDVPVGPTAPLLAAGLAGLWRRKRKG